MKTLSLAFILFCTSFAAEAATITTNFSYGPATTDWSSAFDLPQFDPTLGTLQSVYFEMSTTLVSNVKFESLDAAARTVAYDQNLDVVMSSPVTGLLIQLQPSRSGSESLTSFDGNADFAGSSGRTLAELLIPKSENLTITDALTLLNTYTGTGHLNIGVSAAGSSNFSGSANLFALATAAVGADARVVYTYTPNPIPEPATYALTGLGLVGVAFIRRRRA